MSETERPDPPPTIEDRAALRRQIAELDSGDPASAALGGAIGSMLIALPLAHWLGTDAGVLSGLLGGLGWWLAFAAGLIVVGTLCDAVLGKARGWWAALLLGAGLAGFGWFTLYDNPITAGLLTAVMPIAGLLSRRSAVAEQRERRANPPLGLRDETLAAFSELPEVLAEPVAELLDRAVADASTIDRFVHNGMLDRAGQPGVALRGDVDRAMRALARRALVLDAMHRRGDADTAAPIEDELRRTADELHRLADAVLLAAAQADGGPAVDLEAHIESLRLTTEGHGEIAREVERAG